MAKRKKTITAGCLVKSIIYTAPEPLDGERVRREKSRMTTAAQKAMNDKIARGKLEMLLAANFVGRDLFVTLTCRDGNLPGNRAEARGYIRGFIKALRAQRRVQGQELKYIYVIENKHGEGRFHFHLVINATERDIEDIRGLWPHGDIIDIEYVRERDYETLALYLTKESAESRPVGAQMWTGSRNLDKPIVETSWVPNDTALTVPPGCFVLEREEKQNEYGSYQYIKYRTPAAPQTRAKAPPRGRTARDLPPKHLACNRL